jgi:hypothetical protein
VDWCGGISPTQHKSAPWCWLSASSSRQDICGTEVWTGSSVALWKQLEELNSRTWQADPECLHQWRRDGADYGSPLEIGARSAFSILDELTTAAVRHRLPMARLVNRFRRLPHGLCKHQDALIFVLEELG